MTCFSACIWLNVPVVSDGFACMVLQDVHLLLLDWEIAYMQLLKANSKSTVCTWLIMLVVSDGFACMVLQEVHLRQLDWEVAAYMQLLRATSKSNSLQLLDPACDF